jgi:hypothetical protein
LDATCDDVHEGLGIEGEKVVEGGGAEALVKGGVTNHAILDDLGGAGAQFARGKGAEGGEVAEDEFGLGEGAHDVFDPSKIDGDLASHAGVDCGEEGGGDLDKGDAAPVDGGGKSAEVADDAAAKEQDEGGGAGVGEVVEERGAGLGEFVPVFAFLGGGDVVADDALEAGLGEGGLDDGEIKGSDLGVGEDEGVGLAESVGAEGFAEGGEAAGADENGVGSGAEGDVNAGEHGARMRREGGGIQQRERKRADPEEPSLPLLGTK